MNPLTVASARTARLVREVAVPVYSTSTPAPAREHVSMVEFEDECHRSWSGPFYTVQQQRDEIARMEAVGYWISDIDCSNKCWCVK
jgi:hypothetical protein